MGNWNERLNYMVWCVMPFERKKICIRESFKQLKVKHWNKQSLPQICNVDINSLTEITTTIVEIMLHAIKDMIGMMWRMQIIG